MTLELTDRERAMLGGSEGAARGLAMRVTVRLAQAAGATELIEIRSAHVGGGFHGPAVLDFARLLTSLGARVAVPTTLNIASFDLIHPELYRGDPETGRSARELMKLYAALGGRPTWTCAPYLLESLPAFGDHVAWSESGAVMFANSVLGARTDRGGSFADVCAAIAGRVPFADLHRDENRAAQVRFRLTGFPRKLLAEDAMYQALGYFVGRAAGTAIPVLEGLPADVTRDQLQALGTAAATSGGMGMFHVLGVTPEASTLEAACQGPPPEHVIDISPWQLAAVWRELSAEGVQTIDAVCLGTPHYSFEEFEKLIGLIGDTDRPVGERIAFFVNTNRHVLQRLTERGWDRLLMDAGVKIVTDTCTYLSPMIDPSIHTVMTSSAKWAHYGAVIHRVDVVLGSTRECVRSALLGRVWHDPELWP